jgi:hypothetical protein
MKFFILDQTGHSTLTFDDANVVDLEQALTEFNDLVKERKFTAATRRKGETEYTKVKTAQELQDETLFVPALQGG